MENITMNAINANPTNTGYVLMPSSGCATAPTTPWTLDVPGVAVRDAVPFAGKPATAVVAGAMEFVRERAIAPIGHFCVLAGTRPGLAAWSPPI
ncbi:hypothetical protein [Nocardioides sambongensis]|uniref:hypothetical protein n=1 Tax=Nocardioides sambongensis TaxID=2589074 RepID=UPI00112817AA|nr:hypothetical protein [Nocardioides sambongensis]